MQLYEHLLFFQENLRTCLQTAFCKQEVFEEFLKCFLRAKATEKNDEKI